MLLISLKAGGAGLDLSTANHVLIAEPYWNAGFEQQAIDRAHRIGQQREVHVHRFIMANSIEEQIQQLQAEKQSVTDAYLKEGGGALPGNAFRKALGINELRRLFRAS